MINWIIGGLIIVTTIYIIVSRVNKVRKGKSGCEGCKSAYCGCSAKSNTPS